MCIHCVTLFLCHIFYIYYFNYFVYIYVDRKERFFQPEIVARKFLIARIFGFVIRINSEKTNIQMDKIISS